MPEFQFDVTINVALTIAYADEAAARAIIVKAINDTLSRCLIGATAAPMISRSTMIRISRSSYCPRRTEPVDP